MAKEEERSLPPLIDYNGDPEAEAEEWNSTNVESFWKAALVKKRKLSAHPFTIKDKSLAKRLITEFGVEDLKSMIHWWVEHKKIVEAVNFVQFYTDRQAVYDKIEKKDYSEWEM